MKPKDIYFVEILPGGPPLGYREKGGGHFTAYGAAAERYEHHVNKGRNVVLHHAVPDWKVVFENEAE